MNIVYCWIQQKLFVEYYLTQVGNDFEADVSPVWILEVTPQRIESAATNVVWIIFKHVH